MADATGFAKAGDASRDEDRYRQRAIRTAGSPPAWLGFGLWEIATRDGGGCRQNTGKNTKESRQ